MLIDTFVSSPANSNANPSARANGQQSAPAASPRWAQRYRFAVPAFAYFLCLFVPFAQRVMKYTTDNTTTQMASTKCQYMAKTPIRSACSCLTISQGGEDQMIDSPVSPTSTWKACNPTSE